ncbi:hypothetical protein [Cellulomonas shaoxiangyii]|uniref:Uncharacterized protein n=1 Tax=Cellulomonas shaoxiangyii TaxID=2566013 RepID=A0A4P7SFM2_9CELL|nr:hypothetical protein [Cellulomonas shaoxiangyii]QCB92358.1 hypothetical protein E5225_01100 [Cellulomonas shaoxiangyii]TGY86248.1 hypothetical protein E5226_02765 [Cellulomonas shaoxiangyii]
MATPFDIESPLGTPRTGCVGQEPGHAPVARRVSAAVSAEGETYRVAGVDGGVVQVTRHDGVPARWWTHDPAPFAEHAAAADPTVCLHDGGVVRVGSRYLSVATDAVASPCVEGVVRPTGLRYAFLVRTLPLDPTLVALFPHTASLYRLDPPMRTRSGGYEHVVVLAEQRDGYQVTQIFGSDADGWMRPGDLPGSFEGGMDHVEALNRAGYEVVLPPPA